MSYGRNFEFRIPPQSGGRQGRYCVPATGTVLPIGAPVVVDTVAGIEPIYDLQTLKLAPDGTVRGSGANKGILLFEYGPAAFVGDDPNLVTYSDKDTVPLGEAVQLIGGDERVKVCFRNTVARVRLGLRSYPGRTMVAGMGATPTVVVGQFLVPGVGNDTSGYWKPTATEADGWLVVTKIDSVRGEVEARSLI